VSNDQAPPNLDFEKESSRLTEALQSCRSVISNYRALIANDPEPLDQQGDEAKPNE
jgi:hypothetical protein